MSPVHDRGGAGRMRARLESLLVRYGGIALAIYFAIFALALAGFAIAISTGLKTESTAGFLATLGAAWGATKLTQPLRIAATVALTPLVARLLGRRGQAEGLGAGEGEGGGEDKGISKAATSSGEPENPQT